MAARASKRRDHVGVLGAKRSVTSNLFLPKCASRIRTAEVKGAGLGKFIPQLFKPKSGIVPFCAHKSAAIFTEHKESLAFHGSSGLLLAEFISKLEKKLSRIGPTASPCPLGRSQHTRLTALSKDLVDLNSRVFDCLCRKERSEDTSI